MYGVPEGHRGSGNVMGWSLIDIGGPDYFNDSDRGPDYDILNILFWV